MQRSFERILYQTNPQYETSEKLSSDTIFQYLYEYTLMYVRQAYLQADQVVDGSRASNKNLDSIKGLSVRVELTPEKSDYMDQNTIKVKLPEDFFLYIRSNSRLHKMYKYGDNHDSIAPNQTINEDNLKRVQTTYYDHPIIRKPFVILNSGKVNDSDNYMNIIHDNYSEITEVELMYYRKPKQFGTKHVEGTEMLDHCELPENVHMEIVEGAVSLFLSTKGLGQQQNVKQQDTQEPDKTDKQ